MARSNASLEFESPEWVVRTLLFVDIFESVRLMEENEAGTVQRWRALVRAVDEDILPRFEGRLVKSLGDGLLMEFPEAPLAVRAAFAVQNACVGINEDVPQDQHILVREGAHVGHLLADERDIYGADVNLAARLTGLAGPGEIVVSADVRDQLVPVLDADVEDLGACYLKHVHAPVRAYRIGPPGPHPVIEPGPLSMPQLRPTVAVVPFAGRNEEPEHRVIGEVLADEIISSLSRSSELNVISRLSTSVFRGRDSSVEEISSHLTANYVLSGSYRKAGSKLRVNLELASSASLTIVWSDSFVCSASALISGRDDATAGIVKAVSLAIMARELERAQSQSLPTVESYTLLMGAIALMHRLSLQDFDRSRQMLQVLTERMPRQAVPWAWMAKWHILRVQQGWTDDQNRDAQLALDFGRRALNIDPRCSLALVVMGFAHTNLLKQFDIAQEQYDLALSVNPNDAMAWLLKGTLLAFKDHGRSAVEHTDHALKLSPLDPHSYFYDSLAATAALSAGQYARAIDLASRSLRANRTHTSTFRALAIAQWQLGRQHEARETVAELMKLEPGLTVAKYRERHPSGGFETGRIWSSALQGAGVPQ